MRIERLKKTVAIFALIMLLLASHPVHSEPGENGIWPMFRENPEHTGRSMYYASENPGKLLWRYMTGAMVRSSPAIDFDGTVYIGSDDGYLYAIQRDGSLKWKFRTGGAIHSSPAINKDAVFFGSDDGYLYSIGKNGTLIWRFRTGGAIWSSPLIHGDFIYFGSDDGYLYALNLQGKMEWKFMTNSSIRSSPAAHNGVLYFGSDRIYALLQNGTMLWSFSASSDFQSSPAIGVDGVVYAGCMNGKIYAIDGKGNEIWEFKTGDAISSSPAIGPDGIIYVGSRDGNMYALSHDGGLKWKVSMGAPIWWSSPAISADGMIFVGNYRGDLLALNENGSIVWRYRTGNAIWSSPAIGAEGAVYFGSGNRYIYALWKSRPFPPVNVRAFASQDYVNISWDPPVDDGGSPIIKYEIYRRAPDKEPVLAGVVGGWKTYYADSVRDGERYYYYVVAVNDIGASAKSWEVMAKKIYRPSPPHSLSFKKEGNAVNISWKAPDSGEDIKEYRVYRGLAKGQESYIGSTEKTYFLDMNITYGKTYYYYVKAVNDAGESERSEEIAVRLGTDSGMLIYYGIGALLVVFGGIFIWKKMKK